MTTTYNSNQYANQISVQRSGSPGELKDFFFEGVTATADTGTINFVKLPPGRLRILPGLSQFLCSNMAATANISIGTAAYTATNGAAVAASVDALKAAGLVNACVLANSYTIMANVANTGLLIDSLDGVTITGTVTTANTAVNGTYSGHIAFTYLG
ncbi:MAG: hypothetical protein ABFD60_07840 [Bryobacteraceae bacterium]